ncbi:MAG: VOC family protein [Lachnospiraceae bacterium]|nr:VOC family protein [Lachnospiraceae bacterium]
MALSSTSIVKVIVVTDDLDRTVAAYKKLFGTGTEPKELPRNNCREPFTVYKGQPGGDMPMRVESVFSDNFWFEIIQPMGDNDPWAQWLKDHGTSICSVCLMSDGPLEEDEAFMKEAGYESIFKQEKGFEAYEYFDASKDLGVLVEMKEHYK